MKRAWGYLRAINTSRPIWYTDTIDSKFRTLSPGSAESNKKSAFLSESIEPVILPTPIDRAAFSEAIAIISIDVRMPERPKRRDHSDPFDISCHCTTSCGGRGNSAGVH